MAGAFGGNKGGTPDAPDFSKLAMVNQTNPLGGSTWQTDPVTGQITTTTGFSGQGNDIFQGLLGGMSQAAGMDPAAAGQEAFDKTMGSYKSVLDPMWAANADKMQTGLANSGLDPGTEAYGNASRTFGNARDQAYNSAIAGAVQGGQAEQAQARANANQPFLQGAGFMNMLPHNDPTAPFKGGAAQYDAAKDRSSANNAKKGNTIGGLGNIAGSLFGVGGLGKAGSSAGGVGSGGMNLTPPELM